MDRNGIGPVDRLALPVSSCEIRSVRIDSLTVQTPAERLTENNNVRGL
jgi:hypothetical protein